MTAATSVRRIVTDDRVAKYVSEKCNCQLTPPFTAMGIERDGEIIAGVIFNNFSARDVDVTVAGEQGAFTRGFIKAVGEYVFGKLDCCRMSITTRFKSVCDIAVRLGAKYDGLKPDHYGEGEHAVLLGITRKNWKMK